MENRHSPDCDLAAGGRPTSRLSQIARTWSWAWLGVLFYLPIHPVHHLYLRLPVSLVSSITWALAVAWLLSLQRIARPVLVLAIALLVYEILPSRPWMCNFIESIRAMGPLLRGEIPTEPPIGCLRPFLRRRAPLGQLSRAPDVYPERDQPANAGRQPPLQYPYETINGPTGHLSPFLAESGICWMP